MDAGKPILELGRPSAGWRRRTRKVDAQAWAFLDECENRYVPGGTVAFATVPPEERGRRRITPRWSPEWRNRQECSNSLGRGRMAHLLRVSIRWQRGARIHYDVSST